MHSNKQYIIRFYWLSVYVIRNSTSYHMEIHLAAETWAVCLVWMSRHYSNWYEKDV